MKRIAWSLGLCLLLSSAAAQPVWKCEVAGKLVFSDKPCPQAGQPLAERSLQPNVVEALKPAVVDAAMGRPPAASAPPAPDGSACPGDSEIRGMETRAHSTTLGDAERQFLQDEVRCARQCRNGQGRYREADWAISREARAAQTQIGDRARHDARLRAEAMHSAADPQEGDRIARRRIAEETMQRREQRQLHGTPATASSPTP